MTGFQGYDQWKTASPYDDEPDPVEEAERFLKDHEKVSEHKSPELARAKLIIELLLQCV